jgi:hypothetical protein
METEEPVNVNEPACEYIRSVVAPDGTRTDLWRESGLLVVSVANRECEAIYRKTDNGWEFITVPRQSVLHGVTSWVSMP